MDSFIWRENAMIIEGLLNILPMIQINLAKKKIIFQRFS